MTKESSNGWARFSSDIGPYEPLERPRIRVCIAFPHASGLGNRMFRSDFVVNSSWMDANRRWLEKCRLNNIELATVDLLPIEEADVVIFYDLPEKKESALQVRAKNPKAKMILVLYESPAVAPHAFNTKNHTIFDLILTYNPKLVDGRLYHQLSLPIGKVPSDSCILPFERRRLCVLLNTNIYTAPWDMSRPWHSWGVYKRIKKGGWKIGPLEILRHQRNCNYYRRRTFARAAEHFGDNALDVYGSNWGGLRHGWFRRFWCDPKYRQHQGNFSDDKLKLLPRYRFVFAFENYRSSIGYVSEKLFDAFYAGAVPVYLGDTRITDVAPSDCFIDARQFRNDREILRYLERIPKDEWEMLFSKGREFVAGEKIKRFLPDAFASTMVAAIETVMGTSSSLNPNSA